MKIAAHCCLLALAFGVSFAAADVAFDFGLIIDAGSQGTRIYVYRW